MSMHGFSGPLSGHRNYITHIALANYVHYLKQKKLHEEQGRQGTSSKYDEFRLFLTAVESFNNVLDYLYWEYEYQIKHDGVGAFRSAVHRKFPDLGELANLANAYKHCVRTKGGKNNTGIKNERLPWAKDLQKTELKIQPVPGSSGEDGTLTLRGVYEFSLMKEHETLVSRVFGFWSEYHKNPKTDDLITA